MNREKEYYQSLDALAGALLNNTLDPWEGCACAVGNIVAKANKYKVTSDDDSFIWELEDGTFIENPFWLLLRDVAGNLLPDYANNYYVIDEIKFTGYAPLEIVNIEERFLYPDKFGYELVFGDTEENTFKRLLCVVEYLDEIHEVNEHVGVDLFKEMVAS